MLCNDYTADFGAWEGRVVDVEFVCQIRTQCWPDVYVVFYNPARAGE